MQPSILSIVVGTAMLIACSPSSQQKISVQHIEMEIIKGDPQLNELAQEMKRSFPEKYQEIFIGISQSGRKDSSGFIVTHKKFLNEISKFIPKMSESISKAPDKELAEIARIESKVIINMANVPAFCTARLNGEALGKFPGSDDHADPQHIKNLIDEIMLSVRAARAGMDHPTNRNPRDVDPRTRQAYEDEIRRLSEPAYRLLSGSQSVANASADEQCNAVRVDAQARANLPDHQLATLYAYFRASE